MALTNYTELQTAIANWMHRTNLTGDIPDFITLAEDRIRALLTSNLQESIVQLTTVLGVQSVALPSSALSIKSLSIANVSPNIDYMPPDLFNHEFSMGVSGIPRCYTLIGGTIYLGPTPDAVYTINAALSSEFASLSASAPTNALLTKFPSVYLWGALTEAAKFSRATDWQNGFNSDFLNAMEGVNLRDWNGPGLMTVRTDVRH